VVIKQFLPVDSRAHKGAGVEFHVTERPLTLAAAYARQAAVGLGAARQRASRGPPKPVIGASRAGRGQPTGNRCQPAERRP
jgi:hypothetical protein